jgi:hypothetical protein
MTCNNQSVLSFWRETPKAQKPLLLMTNQLTNQSTAEELKYRCNMARGLCHAMFQVWQNLAPFGGRPIGGAVEALLTKTLVIWTCLTKHKQYLLHKC